MATSSSSSSSSRSIRKLYEFLRLCSRMEGSPGFSTRALKLNETLVDPSRVSFAAEHKTLKLKLLHDKNYSLSKFLAIVDDVTTWALVLADPARARAGKSVHLSAEWGPARRLVTQNDLELTATVTKIGRNLGFCKAQVRTVSSSSSSSSNDNNKNALVCFGSHIKYMPMGFATDVLCSSAGWRFAQWYSDTVLNDPEVVIDADEDLFQSFHYTDSVATFTATKAHASLGGPIHGGCQALLMEMAAIEKLQHDYEMDSMSIQYLGAPSKRDIRIIVDDPICNTSSSSTVTVHVSLLSGNDPRPKSEGVLQFSPKTRAMKSAL